MIEIHGGLKCRFVTKQNQDFHLKVKKKPINNLDRKEE